MGDTSLAGHRVGDHLVRAPEKMRQARLVGGLFEAPVRTPPVPHQDPAVILTQDAFGHIVGPGSLAHRDVIDGHVVTHEYPQPTPLGVHPPAGLIRTYRR